MGSTDSPLVIVAGTFAPRRGAARFYAPLLRDRSEAHVVALRHLGMANTRDSAMDLHRWCEQRFDQPVTLVGHSQGALVAAWLWLHRPERYRPPVLLAGPWAGAPGCQTWAPLGAALRSMARESRFLREMSETFGALREDEKAEMTVVCGTGDRLVSPATAVVPGATNICVAPLRDHDRLAREHPDALLVEGHLSHTSMPRDPFVRAVVDAHTAGAAGHSARAVAVAAMTVVPLPVVEPVIVAPALAG